MIRQRDTTPVSAHACEEQLEDFSLEDDSTPPAGDETPPADRGDLTRALQAERARAKNLKSQLDSMAEQVAELKAREDQRQQDAEAASRKAAEEQGEYKRLYEEATAALNAEKAAHEATRTELDAKLASTNETLTTLQQRETDRMEALKASNTERAAALPEHLQVLIPEGLGPDATALQLTRLEGLTSDERPRGGRSGGGTPPPSDTIPEAISAQVEQEAAKYGRDPLDWYRANKKRFDRRLPKT